MRNASKQKGITLIALVITIIILLILAGISISSLTQSGLFTKAQDAKQETENAQANEEATLAEYEQWIANYTGGSTTEEDSTTVESETLASKVQPGDYVTYTPDTVSTTDETYTNLISELGTYSGSTANTTSTLTQETLYWMVLDIVKDEQENDCVRLISRQPTTSTVALSGCNGYNNAVYLLDKTCKTLYSKTGYSDNVQNLKIEDIQKYMTITDYTEINSSYGTTFSTTHYKYYPSVFAQETGQTVDGETGTLGLSEQTTPINQTTTNEATSWTAKETHWKKSMEMSDFKYFEYYELFISFANKKEYWLSSRSVDVDDSAALFHVRLINGKEVGEHAMFVSAGGSYGEPAFGLRPVITLNSNVLVKSGDGTYSSTYKIGL